jgi:hypothetical protein
MVVGHHGAHAAMSERSHAPAASQNCAWPPPGSLRRQSPPGHPRSAPRVSAEPIMDTRAPLRRRILAGFKRHAVALPGARRCVVADLFGLYWLGRSASAMIRHPERQTALKPRGLLPLPARSHEPAHAIITAIASQANIRNWPKPSPMPSEWANHAKPKPAARPPNMAPHGFLGAAAVWVGPPMLRGLLVPHSWPAGAGAPGAASHCSTACQPTCRRHPSFGFGGQARSPASTLAKINVHLHFSKSPKLPAMPTFSTLDSNMQGHQAAVMLW